MKLAIIGSRGLTDIDIEKYIPEGVCEIVSGGAKGVDTLAREYAVKHGFLLTEFLPEYGKYRRNAPLVRNEKIIGYADEVLAFWDGKSRGTRFTIEKCREMGKKVTVITLEQA